MPGERTERMVRSRHCRVTATHPPHTYQLTGRVLDSGPFECPGVPEDHALYCCAKHDTHVVPHRGCILR